MDEIVRRLRREELLRSRSRSRSLCEEEGWAILTLTEFEGDKDVEVAALNVDVMVKTGRRVGVTRVQFSG